MFRIALALACAAAPPAAAQPIAAPIKPSVQEPAAAKLLPPRMLRCTLGRMTNIDTRRVQRADEIVYEGAHRFDLFLPPIPVRAGPPPDPIEPAEPVDKRTRLVADPDGLAKGVPARFDRVVDEWPKRTELLTFIEGVRSSIIIITDFDAATNTATLFTTRANGDITSYDFDRIYQGQCAVAAS